MILGVLVFFGLVWVALFGQRPLGLRYRGLNAYAFVALQNEVNNCRFQLFVIRVAQLTDSGVRFTYQSVRLVFDFVFKFFENIVILAQNFTFCDIRLYRSVYQFRKIFFSGGDMRPTGRLYRLFGS